MGKADILTRNYLKRAEIFADVFNQFLYGGAQVILPENLQELDTAMLAVPYGAGDVGVPAQKYRDGLKLLVGMTDGNAAYCILGAEGQLNVHYAIPVRNGLYDFLQLSQQAAEAAKSHERKRKEGSANKDKEKEDGESYHPSGAEYLSGFWKTDRLLPVITVVIYWSAKEWDGSLALREMYSTQDEAVIKYAADYRVNLLAPYYMTEEETGRFRTDMKEIMLYIKYSKDKKKLEEITKGNKKFLAMGREAADLINSVTNSKLKYPEGEEEIDMCQAIREMREEERNTTKKEHIVTILEKKGGELSSGLRQRIENEADGTVLDKWFLWSIDTSSAEEFEAKLNENDN